MQLVKCGGVCVHHPILLGSVNTRVLENNTIIFEKGLELKEFSTIVTSKNFDMRFKLSGNITKEMFYKRLCFIFMFHHKNPSEARVIINNSKEIMCTRK